MGDIADDLREKAEDEFYGGNIKFEKENSDIPTQMIRGKKYAVLFGHLHETRYKTDDLIDTEDWSTEPIPVPAHWLGEVVRDDEIVYRRFSPDMFY